jgi:hypothetical protein
MQGGSPCKMVWHEFVVACPQNVYHCRKISCPWYRYAYACISFVDIIWRRALAARSKILSVILVLKQYRSMWLIRGEKAPDYAFWKVKATYCEIFCIGLAEKTLWHTYTHLQKFAMRGYKFVTVNWKYLQIKFNISTYITLLQTCFGSGSDFQTFLSFGSAV